MSHVAVMRVLKKAVGAGGRLFNADDHAGAYKVYLEAAKDILENHTAEDAELREIVSKAIGEAEALENSAHGGPTEQVWVLRQAFDLIKDRKRGGAAPAGVPKAESSAEGSLTPRTCAMGRAAEQAKEVRVKREKQDKQLVNTCKEIHQTEEAYVADLQAVVTVFMGPARERELLGAKDAQEIFSNVEELLRCNSALLEALAPLGATSEDDPTDLLVVIAKAFKLVAPFFVMYTAYCAKYDAALKRLAACRKESSKLDAFLLEASRLPQCKGLALESFLIKPIQRLTKYPLFFKDLQKHIPDEHEMKGSLADAARLVSEVAQKVNTNIDDPAAKMAERLQPLGAEWLNLLAPHRELDIECDCFIHADKRFPAVVYVFTDLLLVCKRKDAGHLNPWLLVRLPQCMIGDNALLTETAADGGLYSGPVEVPAEGGFFGKSKAAETLTEWVLCMRVLGEEAWWLHCSSEGQMERLLNALDAALARMHHQDWQMRQRGLARRASAIGANEGVIDELCAKLQVMTIKKGQRQVAEKGCDGVTLPQGVLSISTKSRTISSSASRSSRRTQEEPSAADDWVPAVIFMPSIATEELTPLEPKQYLGKWYTAAHLPYFRERKAFNEAETFTWDGDTKVMTWERTFNEGGAAGPERRYVREGTITEGNFRDWRLRQKEGSLLLPQTPYTILHMSANGGGMMLAHGDGGKSPGLSYLWLLTRVSPAADDFKSYEMDSMMDLAKDAGFDVSNLRIVPHK